MEEKENSTPARKNIFSRLAGNAGIFVIGLAEIGRAHV